MRSIIILLMACAATNAAAQNSTNRLAIGERMDEATRSKAHNTLERFRAKMPVPVIRIYYLPSHKNVVYRLLCDISSVKNAPKETMTLDLTLPTTATDDDLDIGIDYMAKMASSLVKSLESGAKLPDDAGFEIETKRRRSL